MPNPCGAIVLHSQMLFASKCDQSIQSLNATRSDTHMPVSGSSHTIPEATA